MQALIFGYLFIKKKVRAPSAAVSRGKTEPAAKNSDRFKISFAEHFVVLACARMTTVLDKPHYNHKDTKNTKLIPGNLSVFVT